VFAGGGLQSPLYDRHLHVGSLGCREQYGIYIIILAMGIPSTRVRRSKLGYDILGNLIMYEAHAIRCSLDAHIVHVLIENYNSALEQK
jgi:hypothetical protein